MITLRDPVEEVESVCRDFGPLTVAEREQFCNCGDEEVQMIIVQAEVHCNRKYIFIYLFFKTHTNLF